MAPASGSPDDFNFIMTCLKHVETKPKIDFDEVAKEIGAKSGSACYHRHWGIMKKWGLAGGSGRGRQPASATADKVTTSRKRKVKDEENGDGGPAAKKAKAAAKKKAMQPKVEEVNSENDTKDEKQSIKSEVEDELEDEEE
ncbi:hypothetical protein AYL99_03349 [Fonsecaea erecta]|uniref:Myb-like DNA-binding domain-containing protein n=1 Tax=Fonsecaea erecta TaxID=1367422 RepID=A0A178ZMV9_9EURO|nr:hypothetical protein AYL99_03349 [Fonsecaea erecta]OAP61148.1 hypothetical protein AYL99_03349 [Fonsecaea erecta]